MNEARIYASAGFHAVMIENTHDRPYLKGTVGPEIVAALAVIGVEVRRATSLPVGIQVLAGPTKARWPWRWPAAQASFGSRDSSSRTWRTRG